MSAVIQTGIWQGFTWEEVDAMKEDVVRRSEEFEGEFDQEDIHEP